MISGLTVTRNYNAPHVSREAKHATKQWFTPNIVPHNQCVINSSSPSHFSLPHFLSLFSFPSFHFFSSFPPSPLVLICIYDGFLKFPLAVLWVGPYIHSHLNSLVFHYFLIGTAREEDERWSVYARFLHASLVSTAQMETYIYTWEQWSWGRGNIGEWSSKPTVNGSWVACG